ncbi:MAG: hypothetical protein GVY16_10615, partial [Planctomycetes bacterium]|nr:hypothetical protein [Planctomycetota bacterium]
MASSIGKTLVIGLVLSLALTSPLAAAESFSDEDVRQAIEKGMEYLRSTQQADGSWGDAKGGVH